MSESVLKVATICTGNICRSPMAEVVLKHLIADDPSLNGRVEVTSAGVANWHVGDADGPPRATRPRSRRLPPPTVRPAPTRPRSTWMLRISSPS